MNGCIQQLEAVIRATVIHSPTTYSWFGKQSQRLPPAVKRALTPKTARSFLLFHLQYLLYTDFYCRGYAAPTPWEIPSSHIAGVRPFVEALSSANSGCGYWEDGWQVRANTDGMVVVSNGQDRPTLWVRPEDCLIPEGSSILPGTQLSLRFPKEYLGISPGFYMALGNQPLSHDNSQTLVRFYWNLTPEGAVPFVQHATTLLNEVGLPFQLKVLNDPASFVRCDAAVIYVLRSDYNAVAQILGRVHTELIDKLKQNTPAFTKTLAAGLGLAEDPGGSESFGMHRCRILADGLISAYEQGTNSIEGRMQIVLDRFAEAKINLEEAYLNSGSKDDYHFEPSVRPPSYFSNDTITIPDAILNTEALIRTADEIGRRLAREAVWYGNRCNWVGAELEERGRTSGQFSITHRALGPDLYGGTSGVAIFLAELHSVTADSVVRSTALGAIWQALSHINTIPPARRLGLYTGWTGLALAAAHVGTILDEEELLEHAKQLLHCPVFMNEDDGHEFDLMSGNAGAIVGLLPLQDALADTSLLDFAVELGEELLRTAHKTEAGYSWKSVALPQQRNLTGFSHGTAGVAYALLELFQATGESKYLGAAEQAFQYERHWFDPDTGNWPDLREVPIRGKWIEQSLPFSTYWCHGAPGIALSRLRAYEVTAEKTYQTEAVTALHTTRKMVERTLHTGIETFSLCHGLAGNAEVLLCGCQLLEQKRTYMSDLASVVANVGIETYAKRGFSWPCGFGYRETPNLMLGLAGIGYFYLRLHDSKVPSILSLRREDFLKRWFPPNHR